LELAICEDPDDPRAWTVFGDWLQSQGDPRGEAIALADRLREKVLPREERQRLTGRYRELCAPARWLEGMPQRMTEEAPEDADIWPVNQGWPDEGNPNALPPSLSELEWRHGFVIGASIRFASGSSAWIELLDRFMALSCTSMISRLSVNFLAPKDAERLLASGLMRRVRSLRFQHTSVHAVMPVLSSIERLQHLDLDDFCSYTQPPEDEGWFRTLADLPAVEGLRSLALTRTGVDLEALCSSSRLARLETLRLVDNPVGAAGTAVLASSSLASSLRSLTLSGCALGDEGLVPLAESPALQALEALALHHHGHTVCAAETIATSLLVGLTRLDMSHNDLCDAGVQALLSSPVLHGLRVLRVSHNRLGPRYDQAAHTEAFRALPHLVEFTAGQQGPMTRRSPQLPHRQSDCYTSAGE
jgi:uncharacterized protein (TIGR02996 family)